MPTSKPNEEQLRLLQQYADILLPERDAELITVAGQVDVAAKAARDALQPPASLARSIDDAIRAHYALPNGELSTARQPVVIPAMPRAPRLPDGLDNGTMSPHPRSRLRRWTEPLAATAAIVLVAALLVAVFRPGGADEDEDDAAGGSLATSTTSSATSGLPADAALPTAEDALAWAISRHGLTSRERDKPAYTAGVWLGTLGEVRAKQWYGGTTYAPHLEGIPEMPVWEIEVDDFIGMDVCEHQTDLSEFPECSWNHAIVVVNAVTGDELGFFVPERADAPVMPRLPRPVPEARVDSLDAAMRRAHELVPGLDGQPARIISARLMPMGDSWQMESNQDPATLVWQVEFLDADREAVCPDGSTCTPGHLTIVIDSLAGAEIAVRAGGPSPGVVLQPWPTPRPATPDPSTVQAPQPSANVDAIARRTR
jgi:hypothetical protein